MSLALLRKSANKETLGNKGSRARVLKIGLAWHNFASKNLGVSALAYSHVKLLLDILHTNGVDGRFFAYGDGIATAPGTPLEIDGCGDIQVEYEPISLRRLPREMVRDPGSALLRFRGCDVVFDNSAGDSFTDIYGWKRFFTQAFYKISVIGSRVPLILSPQTIGPFHHTISRRVGVAILKRCQLVAARDSASLGRLMECGLEANSILSTDVAFNLPYGMDGGTAIADYRTRVGVNVSGLLLNGGYNRSNQFGLNFNYREFVLRLIDALCALNGVEVILVPHVMSSERGGIEDDFNACKLINMERPKTVVAPKFQGPIEAKTYISGLDFFIGSRMHSVIAAFSAGVPVVPVAYSAKFNRLFGDLGYLESCDARRQSIDEINTTILQCLANRDRLAKLINDGNRIAKEKLDAYKSHVSDLIEAIVRESRHEIR